MNLIECKTIFGIKSKITAKELKSIYKKKALELHPDHNKSPNASEEFRKLKEAFEFLKNNLNKLDNKSKTKPSTVKADIISYANKIDNGIYSVILPKDVDVSENDYTFYVSYNYTTFRIIFKKGEPIPKTAKFGDGIIHLILRDNMSDFSKLWMDNTVSRHFK